MNFNAENYLTCLEGSILPPQQKIAILEALWNMLLVFRDRAKGLDEAGITNHFNVQKDSNLPSGKLNFENSLKSKFQAAVEY